MCNPALAVAVAAAAASTYMASRANSKVVKARNSAASAEAERQGKIEKRAIASFDDTAGNFTRPVQDQRLADVTASREQDFQSNVQDVLPPSAIPTTASAPKVVSQNLGNELSESIGRGKDFAKRLARFGSFGETGFENAVDLSRGAETARRLANFSAGSANILPLEFQAANQAGAGQRQAADIFGSISGVAGGAAARGAFAPETGLGSETRQNAQKYRGV
jgi:hypothetical protein